MPIKDRARRREVAREWMRARRAAFFAGKSCAKCGSTEPPPPEDGRHRRSWLELDHIDPALKISHAIWSWSEQRRTTEIAKCQVLCSACHDDKTFGRPVGKHAPHGTRNRYRSGCHCDPCRRANTARVNASFGRV